VSDTYNHGGVRLSFTRGSRKEYNRTFAPKGGVCCTQGKDRGGSRESKRGIIKDATSGKGGGGGIITATDNRSQLNCKIESKKNS